MKKAFTMIELVFVIVVIGILAVVAVPKLAPLVDTAQEGKAKATLASVRSAIATERQKRILRGNYTAIGSLRMNKGHNRPIFDYFDGNSTAGNEVLDYPMRSCKTSSSRGCWVAVTDAKAYYYRMSSGPNVKFTLDKNHFTCNSIGVSPKAKACRALSE